MMFIEIRNFDMLNINNFMFLYLSSGQSRIYIMRNKRLIIGNLVDLMSNCQLLKHLNDPDVYHVLIIINFIIMVSGRKSL
jgi:hypothetical protein